MGKRVYPLQCIRQWFAYDIEEVCALFKTHRLHPQTVRGWLKNGLPSIGSGKPTLIYGGELKAYLAEMNTRNKCTTEFGQMFCMRCKDAMRPHKKTIALEQVRGTVRAKAHCHTCRTMMNKNYKLSDISALRRMFTVSDILEVYESTTPPLNTHLAHHPKCSKNEPQQGELLL